MQSALLSASLSLTIVSHAIASTPGQEDRRVARAKAVLVSQLDATLPAISLEHWMSGLARSGTIVRWTPGNCLATHKSNDPSHPICVVARAESASGRVAAVSVWLGQGRLEAWGTPRVEEIFVDAGNESLTVPRLGELPTAVRWAPARWPRPELGVEQQGVRCLPRIPAPGTSVTCEIVIQNGGGTAAHAVMYLNPFVEGEDTCCPGGRWEGEVAANGSTRTQVRLRWPDRGAGIGTRIELVTPSAFGGHRSPARESNTKNNAVWLRLPFPG
jgi:hypothetical protein